MVSSRALKLRELLIARADSLNLPPYLIGDPLRRSGEKLSELCLWAMVHVDEFYENGDRCLESLKVPRIFYNMK